jgi:hypothetical protein
MLPGRSVVLKTEMESRKYHEPVWADEDDPPDRF